MEICQEITNKIFGYIPNKKYLINKNLQKEYIIYLKSKLNIIIKFLRFVKNIKKLCKYVYFIANKKHCWTKNTLIKFIMVNYIEDVDCGLPNIMVGSYNLNVNLLNIIKNKTKAYYIYKFLKQDDIQSEMIINCWYTYYYS